MSYANKDSCRAMLAYWSMQIDIKADDGNRNALVDAQRSLYLATVKWR